MEMLVGMLGAVIGVGLFICGFFLGKNTNRVKSVEKSEMTPEELEAIRSERERLIAEQNAFRTMMNYNADVAYGLTNNPMSQAGDQR